MKKTFEVTIYPEVGKLYQSPYIGECQVSKVLEGEIEIIPVSDSTPRAISYMEFYRWFGHQGGK